MCPSFGTHETDVGDVMLPTGIGATRNIDANSTDLGEPTLLKFCADGICKTS